MEEQEQLHILGVLQAVPVVDVHALHSRAVRDLQRGQTMGKVRLGKHKITLVIHHSRHFNFRRHLQILQVRNCFRDAVYAYQLKQVSSKRQGRKITENPTF